MSSLASDCALYTTKREVFVETLQIGSNTYG